MCSKSSAAFLIILFLFLNLKSQSLSNRFDRLTFGSDPSRNSITSIIQDEQGFMWFGTKFGLIRFDGYNHKVFIYDHKTKNSLSNNFIRDLLLDNDGKIWIATDGGGISIFDPLKESFSTINLQTAFPDYERINEVWTIHQDNQNPNSVMWVGTSEGLIKFNTADSSFTIFRNDNSAISGNRISCIFEDSKNRLWIGTITDGINIFDKESNFTNRKNHNNIIFNIEADFIWDIIEDSSNTIWFGTQTNGLYKYDEPNKIFINYNHSETKKNSLSEKRVLALLQPKGYSGNFFIGTWEGGLNILNPSNTEFKSYDTNDGLNSTSILSFFQDKSGIVWIGTEKGGVNYILPDKIKFDSYNLSENNNNLAVTSFLKFNDQLLIGSTNGLFVKELESKELKRFSEVYSAIKLSHHNIQSLIKLPNNKILVGTFFGGLNLIDLYKKRSSTILPNEFKDDAVKKLFMDSKKNIWIGTLKSGIIILDENLNIIGKFNKENGKITSNFITDIFEDSNKNIWFGTYRSGLYKFDNKLNLQNYVSIPENKTSLSSNNINAIWEDKNGIIWIATEGGGLNKFNPTANSFEMISESNGLAGNNVKSITNDNSNFLWISTTNGISKLNLIDNSIINFNSDDGLNSNIFTNNSVYKIDETIYLGSTNGFSSFNPISINKNNFIPNVHLTQFLVFNKPIELQKSISYTNEINLRYNQNVFSIHYTALNYIFPERNKYAYRLIGFDNDWIYTKNRSVVYTNLNPGTYLFEVKASNNDGIWNETGTSIKIIVAAPFWMTWWFYLFVILFVITLFYFFYKVRINKLIAMERLRTKIASDLHDEIGSSLTKISINAGLLNYEQNKNEISKRLKNIENTSREVISSMSDIIWSIDARKDKLSELISRMKNTAFDILGDKDIGIEFDINVPQKDIKLPLRFRENIFLIFKEAINNCAKHSNTDKVLVQFIINNNQIKLLISDNGIGMDEIDLNKGNGLQNMKMRAKAIKGEIHYLNKNGFSIEFTSKPFSNHMFG
jgi:ligand-binding sensor domain-containing protein/two-component sensor histidine kinase